MKAKLVAKSSCLCWKWFMVLTWFYGFNFSFLVKKISDIQNLNRRRETNERSLVLKFKVHKRARKGERFCRGFCRSKSFSFLATANVFTEGKLEWTEKIYVKAPAKDLQKKFIMEQLLIVCLLVLTTYKSSDPQAFPFLPFLIFYFSEIF